MTTTVKNMIVGSMITAALVALAAIADIATAYPFGGQNIVMDVLFIVSASLVMYLAYDSYKDIS